MGEFTADEIKRLRELLEIDAIRKTRFLYSQLIDTGRTDELANLFTKDAVCDFGPYGRWEGRDTIGANYREIDPGSPFATMHSTTNHWVELTGLDTAVGRSYLIDVVADKKPEENPIVWLGIYDEDYTKIDGHWLISRCRLQFMWPERHLTDGFPGPFPPN